MVMKSTLFQQFCHIWQRWSTLTINSNMVINPLVEPTNFIDHDIIMNRVNIFFKVINSKVTRSWTTRPKLNMDSWVRRNNFLDSNSVIVRLLKRRIKNLIIHNDQIISICYLCFFQTSKKNGKENLANKPGKSLHFGEVLSKRYQPDQIYWLIWKLELV